MFNSSVLNVSVTSERLDNTELTLARPISLEFGTELSSQARDGQVFVSQPTIKITDEDGEIIKNLGLKSQPWRIRVRLAKGGPRGKLRGKSVISVTEGWANFTNLAIVGAGDHTLQFGVISPREARRFKLTSSSIKV